MSLKIKLDHVFSIFIRLRDTNAEGWGRCVSCDKSVFFGAGNNCHYIPRADLKYRYAEDNCRLGCVSCNKYREGYHYAKYTPVMVLLLGADEVASRWLHWEAKTPHKIRSFEYEEMVEEYTKRIFEILPKKKGHIRKGAILLLEKYIGKKALQPYILQNEIPEDAREES